MVDQMNEFGLAGYSSIFEGGYSSNGVGWYTFDFATPTGDEDATVNKLQVGDLAYVSSSGKVKKLSTTVSNATLKATNYGIVGAMKDDQGNFISEKTFTADGGEVQLIWDKGAKWFGDSVYIYTVVAAGEGVPGTDTRDVFSFATHASSGDPLEDLVGASGESGGRQTYTFK